MSSLFFGQRFSKSGCVLVLSECLYRGVSGIEGGGVGGGGGCYVCADGRLILVSFVKTLSVQFSQSTLDEKECFFPSIMLYWSLQGSVQMPRVTHPS